MRRKQLLTLAVAILLGLAGPLAAQDEMKPVLTISFCGFDGLMANIDAIGRMGGNPDLGKGMEFSLQMMTQGQGMAGLDRTQPWGAAYMADKEGTLAFYCFIPVTALDKLIETGQAMHMLQDVELNDGVYTLQTGGGVKLFAKQQGNWAFFCPQKETLSKVTVDPLKMLGRLAKDYDLAVCASAKNLPEALREQVLTNLRAGFEAGMAQLPDEDDKQFTFRANTAKQSLQQINMLVNEVDDLVLGLNIDPSADTFYLDVEITAKEKTDLAEQLSALKPGKSKFTGFYQTGAAMAACSVSEMSETEAVRAKSSLTALRQSLSAVLEEQELSDEEQQAVVQLLDAVMDCAIKTVEAHKRNSGLSLLLSSESATLVAGGEIVGGDELEKSFVEFVAALKKIDPDTAGLFELNAETYEGIRFHKFAMPVPEPNLEAVLGKELEVIVGLSDTRLYLAAGRNAAASLKEAIGRSQSQADAVMPPSSVSFSAMAIAEFIAAVAPAPDTQATAATFAELLAESEGKDHVLATATPIERGVRVRIQIEEGLLRAISVMSQRFSPVGAMTPMPVPGN